MNISQLSNQLAVITTKEVLSKDSPIITVVVDADGDLQFIGQSGASEADARVVSLGQMLMLDETLFALPEFVTNVRLERTGLPIAWRMTTL